MLAATIAAVLLGLAVQFAVLWGMGDRRPVGDEGAYLERGRSADPHAPRLFLRVPVLPWLAAICHSGAGAREPARGERRLRLLTAIASGLVLGLAAVAGWRLGGPSLALLAVCLLAAHPERILVGCHIWPDTLLAATLAALMVVSTLPEGPGTALLAGGLCTLGVLTRIDFLVAPLFLFASWWASSGPPTAFSTAALLAPPLVALVLLTARNHRRYGIPLPDTTWAFNLLVARAETRLVGDGRLEIAQTVQDTLPAWTGLAPVEAARRGLGALVDTLRSPLRFVRGIVQRLLVLLGPDTFVRQRLLARGGAYPDLGEQPRRLWKISLMIASPLLFTVVLTGAAAGRRVPETFVWPSIGLAAAAILFHTRTRYRVTLLPALSLVAAQEILRFESLLNHPLAAALVLAGGAVLFWWLIRTRSSDELLPEEGRWPESWPSVLPEQRVEGGTGPVRA